jgi:peptidoglycan/LPS O-acetylase OafA/YrhL
MSETGRMQTGGTWRLGHRPGLDGLRGFAILLVLVTHFDHGQQLESGGVMGVKVFFTLSGFLITSLLLEELAEAGEASLREFYIRRALRLGPALVVMLLTISCLALVGWPLNITGPAVAGAAGYVSNWYLLSTMSEDGWIDWGGLGHMWSLAVEEQFYIVWPLLLLVAHRWHGRGGVLTVSTVGAAASLAWWVYTDRHTIATDVSAWCLLAGCALAAFMHQRSAARPSLWLALPVLALVAGVGIEGFGVSWGHVLAPVAAGLAVWVAAQRRVPWLEVGWLRWLGRRSYGLYLWHFPVAYLVGYAHGPWAARAIVGVALSFALAELSWRFVESPALRFKALRSRRMRAESTRGLALARP